MVGHRQAPIRTRSILGCACGSSRRGAQPDSGLAARRHCQLPPGAGVCWEKAQKDSSSLAARAYQTHGWMLAATGQQKVVHSLLPLLWCRSAVEGRADEEMGFRFVRQIQLQPLENEIEPDVVRLA